MARRIRSLHFGDMEGRNVPYHREHRSKRGRLKHRVKGMVPYHGRNGKAAKWKYDFKKYDGYPPPH